MYSLVRAEPEKSTWRITGVLIVGGLGVAIGFPSVDAALGLLGATCSVSLSFIIPALLYSRLVVARDGVAWRAAPRGTPAAVPHVARAARTAAGLAA